MCANLITSRVRLDRLLSNRGYCTRSEAQGLVRRGRVLVKGLPVKSAADKVDPADVTVDGEPVDPERLLLLLHKPAGYTCSHKDSGSLVYGLLPARYMARNPAPSTVGRLDRDTTGLLLITDDGDLLHRLASPKYKLPKVYEAWLESDLRGDEARVFASGTLVLPEETDPVKPAVLEVLEPRHVLLTLTEGRYHQVKRMFEAVGNKVARLHRPRFGPLTLGDLEEGQARPLTTEEEAALRAAVGG